MTATTAELLGGHIVYYDANRKPIGAICNACHFDLETSHVWLSEEEEEKKFKVLDRWCGQCKVTVETAVIKPDDRIEDEKT